MEWVLSHVHLALHKNDPLLSTYESKYTKYLLQEIKQLGNNPLITLMRLYNTDSPKITFNHTDASIQSCKMQNIEKNKE